ncbi:type IX secretion system sortase PorU [Peijinzhouia sedimentorum]
MHLRWLISIILSLWLIPQEQSQPFSTAQEGLLSEGEWYKIAVPKSGVFVIDNQFLASNGISLQGKDSRNIRLFGYPGGTLPQANNAQWPSYLTELAISIDGENDGDFGASDKLYFFAESPHSLTFNSTENRFEYEHNPYTDEIYYLLNIGNTRGKRIESQQANPIGNEINTVRDAVVYTNPTNNILFSGRNWYSERFDVNPNRNFDLDLEGIAPNSILKLTVALMTQSFGASSMVVNAAGQNLGEINLPSIPTGTYSLKGIEVLESFDFSSSVIQDLNTAVRSNLQFKRFTGGGSNVFLNYLILEADRELKPYDEAITFGLENPQSLTLNIKEANAETQLWDLSDSFNAKQLAGTLTSGNLKIGIQNQAGGKWTLFNKSQLPSPNSASKISNQHLKDGSAPDMVIITSATFRTEAERLASHRQSFNGFDVKVVTVDEIYNEFSAGRQDVSAIRNYLKYAYEQGNLKYALMFGRASYDYKSRIEENSNIVPNYQSRNSLHPILTYASDDYFGFLTNNKGTWAEDENGNHDLDIAVGRIPIKFLAEARAAVSKIIDYETNPDGLGDWRTRIVFAADDGDVNIHQRDANRLAQLVDTTQRSIQTQKIYLDDYEIIDGDGSSKVSPDAAQAILEQFEKGAFIVNYTGHGSERQLAAERMFDEEKLRTLRNANKYPIFVTATCEFGRNDDPTLISAAEQMVLNPNAGAIAMVTTSRPVFSSTNYQLNLAFYNHLFTRENGQYLSLGEIFKRTKNTSQNGVLNRNFILLGDPALTPAFPKQTIAITHINESVITSENQEIKALSNVKLQGEIRNYSNSLIADFDGVVEVNVMNEEDSYQTLGQSAGPFSYKARRNSIFKGKATVSDGKFEIEFVSPNGIPEAIKEGAIFMYANSTTGVIDASGVNLDVKIGGRENISLDSNGPVISLFMNDSTFKDGGLTNQNPTLLAYFEDEQGINISKYDTETEMIAILDGTKQYSLAEFYTAAKDDFTKGRLSFPLFELEIGKHSLELFAWDNHDNISSATINFEVGENTKLQLSNVINYPNPMRSDTRFSFEHNKSGEALEIFITIYSVQGQPIRTMNFSESISPTRVDGLEWDGNNKFGAKLSPGIYIYHLTAISVRDGSKFTAKKKLIVSN